MSTIFFDTCAIRYLVKQGLDGEQVRNVLSQRGGQAVIGRNTLFEIAKLSEKNPLEFKKTCDFLISLSPDYTKSYMELFEIEVKKLRYGKLYSSWACEHEKARIDSYNDYLASGNFPDNFMQDLAKRIDNIKRLRAIWQPGYKLKIYYPNANKIAVDVQPYTLELSCNESVLNLCAIDSEKALKTISLSRSHLKCYDEIMKALNASKNISDQFQKEIYKISTQYGYYGYSPDDISKIKSLPFEERVSNASAYREDNLRLYTIFFKNIGQDISKNEVQKFLLNLSDYPALSTIFRAHIYWGDVVATQFDIPAEDRFSDAFQFVEASSCTTFVSEEKKLINENGYGKKLNPGIELLHVSDLVEFAGLDN